MLRLIFLSVFVLCCAFSANGDAKLLNPYSNNHYLGDNNVSCTYLKQKISYLCPSYLDNNACGNSKAMRSFQKISKSAGETIIADGDYVRKTCLSISYNKDWVEGASENYIDPSYPDIVYAFSQGNDTDGYDVYYYVSDDLSPNPTNNDNAIRPLLSGDATQFLQQGNNKYTSKLISLDLSGWNFRDVTSMFKFLSGNDKLTSVTFGTTVDLYKVTNISQMFMDCSSLSNDEFSELVSSFVVNDSKLSDKNAQAKKHSGMTVTTANEIEYNISNSGSFDKKANGVTTMMIRNLDAIQDGRMIDFTWDVVFENESVQSYTVECIDADDVWEHKIDLLTETDCYLIKDNVKLYRPSYVITNDVNFRDHIKRFRLRITYTNGSIGYSDPFDLFCDGELMPITLSSYTLSSHDNTITLSWTTESETNNDYFTVYASSDGVNFTDISRIDGAGTTSTSHSYSLTFDASSIKYIYLSQTDFDGHTESFDIKPVVSAANLHKTFKYGPLNFRVVDNRLEYNEADN